MSGRLVHGFTKLKGTLSHVRDPAGEGALHPLFKTDTTMSKPYRLRAVSSINRAYSSDPLERVEAFSGINADRTRWRLSQAAVVAAIEAGTDEFFVNAGEDVVRLIVVTAGGQKYVQSEREKTHPDDLLSLFVS